MARRPNFDAEDAALDLLRASRGESSRYADEWELVQHVALISREEAEDDQVLAALSLVDALRRRADSYEESLLEALRDQREDPVSWTRIATALGVSRQGAERRYLRARTSGVRDATRARANLRERREREERWVRAATARWGRWAQADRDWRLTVRARTRTREEVTVQLEGAAGWLPTLREVVKVGDTFHHLQHLELLEVVEEVTPWEDVDPPGTLAGLTPDEQQ